MKLFFYRYYNTLMFGFILGFFILNILTKIFFLADFLEPSLSYAMEENSISTSKDFLPIKVVNVKGNCDSLFQKDPSLKETLCNQPGTETIAVAQGKDESYFARSCFSPENVQEISDNNKWIYRSTLKENFSKCQCGQINREFFFSNSKRCKRNLIK